MDDLRWALDGAGVGVWTWDPQVDRVQWSAQVGRIFSVAADRYPARLPDFLQLIYPEDRALVMHALQGAIASGAGDFRIEHRIAAPAGGLRWIRGVGRVSRDASGRVTRFGGTVVDVTAEKAAEAAARQGAELLRLYSELASDYIYVVEVRDGAPLVPTIVAGSFERATGYTPQQVGEHGGWLALVHPDDVGELLEAEAALRRGASFPSHDREYRIRARDGEVRWLRDHARPVLLDGKIVRLVGGVQDITERRALEQQLQHALRMDAVARMAGSVAHDFNNLLSIICSALELLRPHVSGNRAAAELAGDISTACQRAAELTRSLLAFTRKQTAPAKPMRIADVLRATRSMLERIAGDKIRVELEIPETAAVVELDLASFQLVLINLTVNAVAAMPNGGTLSLRADVADPRRVLLEVCDTGDGIPSELLPRIFEPYFTTKSAAEGTGLGLSICRDIVTRFGGTICAASLPGRGTMFSIELPATSRPPEPEVRAVNTGGEGASERILLVEDEAMLAKITKRLLQAYGYRVIVATSLAEARACLDAEPFDLLLCDVHLVDGDGSVFARELRERRPNVPIVMTSGHVTGEQREALERDFVLLMKPYPVTALTTLIREQLDLRRRR